MNVKIHNINPKVVLATNVGMNVLPTNLFNSNNMIKYFTRILEEMGNSGDQTSISSFNLALKMTRDKEDIAKKWDPIINELVTKSFNNGIDLYSMVDSHINQMHNNFGYKGILKLNDPIALSNPSKWLNDNYDSIIGDLLIAFKSINNSIDDVINLFNDKLKDEYSKYFIDIHSVDRNSRLYINYLEFKNWTINQIKIMNNNSKHSSIAEEFDNIFPIKPLLKGSLKESWISDKISNHMINDRTIGALKTMVLENFNSEFSAIKPTSPSKLNARELFRMSFNKIVKKIEPTLIEMEPLLSGISNLIKKYKKIPNNFFTLSKIDSDIFTLNGLNNYFSGDGLYTLRKSKTKVKSRFSFTYNIGGPSYNESKFYKELEFSRSPYPIENFVEVINNLFSNKKAYFDNTKKWKDGDKITRLEILKWKIKKSDSVDWTLLFDKIDEMKQKIPNDKIDIDIIYEGQSGELKFSFIDKSIKNGDFDYGNEIVYPYKGFTLNRHNTVDSFNQSRYPKIFGFTPNKIISPRIKVVYENLIINALEIFERSTQLDNQKMAIPIDEIYENGKYKNLDEKFLSKTFKDFNINFDRSLLSLKNLNYTFKIKNNPKIEEIKGYSKKLGSGVATMVAQFQGPSPKDIYTREFKVRIIHSNLHGDYDSHIISEFENTWEDNTPSINPNSDTFIIARGGGPFIPGGTPTIDNLKKVFNGIEQFDSSSSNYTIKIGKNIHLKNVKSDLTSDELISWNKTILRGFNIPGYKIILDNEELPRLKEEYTKKYGESANNSEYLLSPVTFEYYVPNNIDGKIVKKTDTWHLKVFHTLSQVERNINWDIINIIVYSQIHYAIKRIINKINPNDQNKEELLGDELMKKILPHKNRALSNVKSHLNLEENTLYWYDWMLHYIEDELVEFSNVLKKLGHEYLGDLPNNDNLDDLPIDDLKSASRSFKYILITLAGILGFTSLFTFAIPIRTKLANKKIKIANSNVKLKIRGLIITSTIAGIIASCSSVAIMLYVFVQQGGF